MNKQNKANDWMVAMVNNPTFDVANFEEVGLTPDNTSIGSKQEYRKSDFIAEKFTDQDGKFDETTFNNYYDAALKSYNTFVQGKYEDNLMSNLTYDISNPYRPKDGKIKDLDFNITKIQNPDRVQIGTSSIYGMNDKTKSSSEIAQGEKVWDSENKKWLDWTPDDRGVLKFWTLPTIVKAVYDEDGEHFDASSGRKVKHKKGEYRLNENGTYFYETLGKRQIYGKEVASYFDTLTKEGSWANKYDFFDSDGLDKSVTGTIAKTVATIAPLFVPYVGGAYAVTGIAKELGKLFPVLYKSSFGLLSDDDSALNKLENFSYSLDQSVSDYSKNKVFTVENMFNMVADVALQLQQQRWIFKKTPEILGKLGVGKTEQANFFSKITKAVNNSRSKLTGDQISNLITAETTIRATALQENLQNYAKAISQVYMAGISGMDAYGSAIQAGYGKGEAAVISWATLAGMYGIQKNDVVEKYIYPELAEERMMMKNAIEHVINNSREGINKIAQRKVSDEIKKRSIFQLVKKTANNFLTNTKEGRTGLLGAALIEGTEEVSEELFQDFVKQTADTFSSEDAKFKTFDNGPVERYAMSFLGGVLGGGINKVAMNVQAGKRTSETQRQELIYLIRNHKTDEIKSYLTQEYNKGRLGNVDLSATDYDKQDDGNYYYRSPRDESDSQNSAVYNMSNNYIDYLESILNQENLKMDDDSIIDAAVLREVRYQDLIKSGYHGKLLQDFNSLASNILDAQLQLDDVKSSLSDEAKSKPEHKAEYETKLFKAQTRLDDLRKQYQSFLSGENSEYYLGMTLFGLNNLFSESMTTPTFRSYAEYYSKKNFEDLSESEIESLQQDYNNFNNSQKNDQISTAYEIFRSFNNKYSQKLFDIANDPNFAQGLEVLSKLKEFDHGDVNRKFYGLDLDNKEFIDQANELHKISSSFGMAPIIQGLASTNAQDLIRGGDTPLEIITEVSTIIKNLQSSGNIDQDAYDVLNKYVSKFDSIGAEYLVESWLDGSAVSDIKLDNPDAETQINDILNVVSNIKVSNFDDMIKIVSDQISKLNISDQDKSDLEYAIVGSLNTEYNSTIGTNLKSELAPVLKEIQNLQLNPVKNPFMSLVNDISLNLTGKKLSILDVLTQERQRMNNAERADEYVIEDKVRLEDIQQGKQVLDFIKSLAYASQTIELDGLNPFGYNQSLNNFRQKTKLNDDILGVIPSDVAETFIEQADSLKARLEYLERLSSLNASNQLTEHRKTAVNVRKLLFDVYSGKSNKWLQQSPLFDGIANLVTTSEALNSINPDMLTVSDEEYAKIEKEMIILENKVYDNFQNIKTDDIEADLNRLMFEEGGFDYTNLQNGFTNTDFNSTSKAFENYDLYVYLHSIIALKSSEFSGTLYKVINSGNFEYIPLFSQEYNAKLAVSNVVNPKIFQAALKNIKADDYYHKLQNTIIVNGITGSGKTSATGKLIYEMVNTIYDNPNVWLSGPYDQQITNLQNSFKTDKNGFNKEQLFKAILGDENYDKLQSDLNENNNTLLTVVPLQYKNSTSNKIVVSNLGELEFSKLNIPKVIYIDEITHFNEIELAILSQYAINNNITIVAFGDTEQNGSEGKYREVGYYNIDMYIRMQTPKLAVSMRTTNIQKLDNLNSVRSINSYYNNDINRFYKSTYDTEYNFYLNNLVLKFNESEKSLYGDKVVSTINESDVKKLLNDMDEDEKLLYIYDDENSPTFNLIKSLDPNQEKISRFKSEEVQGSESKYAIIDIDWNKYHNTKLPSSVGNLVKNLYTVITRAKSGSLIFDNGFIKDFKSGNGYLSKLNLKEDDYSVETKYRAEGLDSYMEFRKAILEEYENEVISVPKTESSDIQTQEDQETADPAQNLDQEEEKTETPTKVETTDDNKPLTDPTKEETPSKPVEIKPEVGKTEDNFISDQPEENLFDEDGAKPEDLITYTFYTRFGVNTDGSNVSLNEDLSREDLNLFLNPGETLDVSSADYKRKIEAYFKLKSAILYNDKREFPKLLNNDFSKNLRSDVRYIDWSKGNLELKFKKFEMIDATNLDYKYGSSKELVVPKNGKTVSIVYVVRDANGNIQAEISMMLMPEVSSIIASANNPKNSALKDRKLKLAKQYEEYINKLSSEFKVNGENTIYKKLNINKLNVRNAQYLYFNEDGSKRTKEDMKNPEKRVKYNNLNDVINKSPQITWSDPYIITNYDTDFISSEKDPMEGKSVIFFTHNKNLTESDGSPVSKNDLAYYYRNSFDSEGKRTRFDVNMLKLSSEGVTFKEFLDIQENLEIQRLDKKTNIFGSVGNKNTATRIFQMLWNARTELLNKRSSKGLSEDETNDLRYYNNIIKDLTSLLPALSINQSPTFFMKSDNKELLNAINAIGEQAAIYDLDQKIELPKDIKFKESWNLLRALKLVFKRNGSLNLYDIKKGVKTERNIHPNELEFHIDLVNELVAKNFPSGIFYESLFKKNISGQSSQFFAYPARNVATEYRTSAIVESPLIFIPFTSLSIEDAVRSNSQVEMNKKYISAFNDNVINGTKSLNSKIFNLLLQGSMFDTMTNYNTNDDYDLSNYSKDFVRTVNNSLLRDHKDRMFAHDVDPKQSFIVTNIKLNEDRSLSIDTLTLDNFIKSTLGKENTDLDYNLEIDPDTLNSGYFSLTSTPENKIYFEVKNDKFNIVSMNTTNTFDSNPENINKVNEELLGMKQELLNEIETVWQDPIISSIDVNRDSYNYAMKVINNMEMERDDQRLHLKVNQQFAMRAKVNADYKKAFENYSNFMNKMNDIEDREVNNNNICKA